MALRFTPAEIPPLAAGGIEARRLAGGPLRQISRVVTLADPQQSSVIHPRTVTKTSGVDVREHGVGLEIDFVSVVGA